MPTPDPTPEDPLSTALQHLLAAHTRTQGALARRLGTRATDVDTLEHLTIGPLGPGELARQLGVTPGAATQAVERLERRGHARRAPDPDDGRRVVVALTDEGRDTVLGHLMPALERLDDLHRDLDDDARAAILHYLEGATAAFLAVADER